MIFPGAATQGRPEAVVGAQPGRELLALSSEGGERIAALFGPALCASGAPHPRPASRPTILYFYGNAMCIADCLVEFERFRRLGINMLVPEFLGYGMSEGKASEAGVYATGEAAWRHLRQRKDIDAGRIFVAGWSLGSAAAVELASKHPVAGLMVFSSFTSMAELARTAVPWAPTSLLRHHFENERKMKKVNAPILIVHGRRDSIIPFEMSLRLKSAAPQAQLLEISSADHNDLFDVGAEEIYPAIARFME